MCEDINARIIIKQGSGVPTIPASTDHRNGDWLATDIYEGEMYMDNDTGLTYTSNGGVIQMADGSKQRLVFKANISQSGVAAPVVTIIENSLGITNVPSYLGVGSFQIAGFAGLLVNPCEISVTLATSGGTELFEAVAATSSILLLTSQSGGVAANGVIDGVGTTITVTCYY
tara:strand:- start:22310 stop:22825 length:516 start_codon:yes stop_codon:yes gene_type:complete